MKHQRTFWQRARRATAFILLLSGLISTPAALRASDHDDGEEPTKGRNRNLTDLFVFREGDQTGNTADNANLIFIMNTNPRSLARQQYFFSSTARYEFHVQRVGDRNTRAKGIDDLVIRFEFGNPNADSQQAITMTLVKFTNGTEASSTAVSLSPGLTTAAPPGLVTPNATPVSNTGTADGQTVTVFAGLREDPFFFDVEQYFRVRSFILGTGADPNPGQANKFRDLDHAIDFAKGYNVNAIVLRVPIALLQQGTTDTIFDVWETISAQ
jgi:hypothetical protein